MNSLDDQLNRLFRSAAQGRAESLAVPPYGLETRVLAAWRAAGRAPAGFWDMTLLMRGLILAGVLMAVSFWPALTSATTTVSSNPFADFLQLTDSTVPSDDAP